MMRILVALVAIMTSVAGLFFGLDPSGASATLSHGEFWRLPWPAGSTHIVGGYGYGEGVTHINDNYWALDLNIPQGNYVTNVQEGEVIAVGSETQCGSDYGSGTYLDILDVHGFVHHYAHLEQRFFNRFDHVLAGWVIGKSGSTGFLIPCGTASAHLHYRIMSSSQCSGGPCIPEPMSSQCADWSYKGYPVFCQHQGSQHAFSYDPSSGDPSWKANSHVSNNAGVGDKPVVEGAAIQNDGPIINRYLDESAHHGLPGVSIVGKPANPYNFSWYVHRWESYAGSGWIQDFDSPNATYGNGAIMHGDTAVHNPADGRANINAAWIYGKFWTEYLGSCVPWSGGPPQQYIHFLGYPTSERYSDGFGIVRQLFQNGSIYWVPPYDPNQVQLHDLSDQRFGPDCDDPLPPPPTPTPTRTPTKTPTKTPTPLPPTSTPTPVPPTATPTSTIDADGDGCSNVEELGALPELGGDRDPNYYWDFFDVDGTQWIDMLDVNIILAHHGHTAEQDAMDNQLDRTHDPVKPWRSIEANSGVDLLDALAALQQFGHDCGAPPYPEVPPPGLPPPLPSPA